MKTELSHSITLIFRILLIVFLYQVCRLLFLIFNHDFFVSTPVDLVLATFWYGTLFDLSSILYINLVFIFIFLLPFKFRENRAIETLLKYLFIVTNSIGILMNIIDFEFFKFTNKRSGIELFEERGDVGNVLVSYFADFWYLVLIFIVFIFVIVWFYDKLKLKKTPTYTPVSYLVQSGVFIVGMGLFILGARGGTNLKPIRPFDATRYVSPALMPVVLNTPFTMIFTAGNYSMKEKKYMPDQVAIQLFNPIKYPEPGQSFKKENVVLIILESFGKEYIGFFNNGKGYTPFLDSLCRESLVFMNAYADGKSSNTGVPAILMSIPSWMNVPYLNSNYQGNRVNSTGELLQSKGYYTAFFHGARNGSMGLDNLVAMSESGEYFGMDQYPQKTDFDGDWGIYDEPFLQFVLNTINTKTEPFYLTCFTLSSHHPYHIPARLKNKFKGGDHPIYKSVEYADYSLRKFFEGASKTKWYKNTLFVLTADHSAINKSAFYQTTAGRYAIPLIFFKPGGSLKGKRYRVVQQLDIMPGILGYLNYDHPYFALGKNIMQNNYRSSAIQYDEGIWQYIDSEYILQFNGKKPVGFFDYLKDPLMEHNLVREKPEHMGEMITYLKAVIQVYSVSLNENKTFISPR